MGHPTHKQMAIGGISLGLIAAIVSATLVIGDRFDQRYLLRSQYETFSNAKQVQIINIQILQVEMQIEIIEQRRKNDASRDGDETRYKKLLSQLQQLYIARDELLRK